MYAIPVVLFLGLVTLVLTVPGYSRRQARGQAEALATELVDRRGFSSSHAIEDVVAEDHAAPFHYGTRHTFENDLTGSLHDAPVSTSSYTCRYNGETHRYGVAIVGLDHDVERVEVRDRPAFSTPWARDVPPHNRVHTGSQWFDDRFETYSPNRDDDTMLMARNTPELLGGVKEPFSMRADGRRLLLWRSPGWSSAEALDEDVTAAVAALGPAPLSGWRSAAAEDRR